MVFSKLTRKEARTAYHREIKKHSTYLSVHFICFAHNEVCPPNKVRTIDSHDPTWTRRLIDLWKRKANMKVFLLDLLLRCPWSDVSGVHRGAAKVLARIVIPVCCVVLSQTWKAELRFGPHYLSGGIQMRNNEWGVLLDCDIVIIIFSPLLLLLLLWISALIQQILTLRSFQWPTLL